MTATGQGQEKAVSYASVLFDSSRNASQAGRGRKMGKIADNESDFDHVSSASIFYGFCSA